jgi:hypothetical protein
MVQYRFDDEVKDDTHWCSHPRNAQTSSSNLGSNICWRRLEEKNDGKKCFVTRWWWLFCLRNLRPGRGCSVSSTTWSMCHFLSRSLNTRNHRRYSPRNVSVGREELMMWEVYIIDYETLWIIGRTQEVGVERSTYGRWEGVHEWTPGDDHHADVRQSGPVHPRQSQYPDVNFKNGCTENESGRVYQNMWHTRRLIYRVTSRIFGDLVGRATPYNLTWIHKYLKNFDGPRRPLLRGESVPFNTRLYGKHGDQVEPLPDVSTSGPTFLLGECAQRSVWGSNINGNGTPRTNGGE